MRKQLADLGSSERRTFVGTFARFGTKNGWRGRIEQTCLLKDIREPGGQVITDHLWFNLTKAFAALSLEMGDMVQFEARVKPYLKGYVSRDHPFATQEIDYRLDRPTRVKKVGRVSDAELEQMRQEEQARLAEIERRKVYREEYYRQQWQEAIEAAKSRTPQRALTMTVSRQAERSKRNEAKPNQGASQ